MNAAGRRPFQSLVRVACAIAERVRGFDALAATGFPPAR
jgi:hypothetical protein